MNLSEENQEQIETLRGELGKLMEELREAHKRGDKEEVNRLFTLVSTKNYFLNQLLSIY